MIGNRWTMITFRNSLCARWSCHPLGTDLHNILDLDERVLAVYVFMEKEWTSPSGTKGTKLSLLKKLLFKAHTKFEKCTGLDKPKESTVKAKF